MYSELIDPQPWTDGEPRSFREQVGKDTLYYTDRKTALLQRIIGHSFWVGFYTACLALIIVSICYGAVIGRHGPVERAMYGEKVTERGKVQPDEQPDSRDRLRGRPLH